MASQITHIVYGTKFLEKFLSDQVVDRRKFYIGTSFPDIRYLGLIDREITHSGELTIGAIKSEKNDFGKGRLTHCLVDLERDKIIKNLGIYDLVSHNQMTYAVLKHIEDEINYDLVDDFAEIRGYLSSGALDEELAFTSKDIVLEWHELLREYFSKPPTLESALKLAKNLVLTDEQINQTKKSIEELRKNEELVGRLKLIYKKLFES